MAADWLDDETLDAIDRAETQIQTGETHRWEEVRDHLRAKLSGEQAGA